MANLTHPNEVTLTIENTSEMLSEALKLDMAGGFVYREALHEQLRRQLMARVDDRYNERRIRS